MSIKLLFISVLSYARLLIYRIDNGSRNEVFPLSPLLDTGVSVYTRYR